MQRGGVFMLLCAPQPQVRERRGTGKDFSTIEGAFSRCPLQGQRAASPRVVHGVVVVEKVT